MHCMHPSMHIHTRACTHLRLVDQQVHLIHQHHTRAALLAPRAAAARRKHLFKGSGSGLRARAVAGQGLQGGVVVAGGRSVVSAGQAWGNP